MAGLVILLIVVVVICCESVSNYVGGASWRVSLLKKAQLTSL